MSKIEFSCENCGAKFEDYPVNRRWKHVFCSKSCKGKWYFTNDNPAKKESVRRILSEQKMGDKNPRFGKPSWNSGKKGLQVAWNKGKSYPQFQGKNSSNWKGGITPINKAIRNSPKYKRWREAVFERDDYTCVRCGERGGTLNGDHIKSFSMFPELRFDLNNGRTLCVPCHKKTDTYAGRGRIYNKA